MTAGRTLEATQARVLAEALLARDQERWALARRVLTERQLHALVLRQSGRFSWRALAWCLGLSPRAVRDRVARAEQILTQARRAT